MHLISFVPIRSIHRRDAQGRLCTSRHLGQIDHDLQLYRSSTLDHLDPNMPLRDVGAGSLQYTVLVHIQARKHVPDNTVNNTVPALQRALDHIDEGFILPWNIYIIRSGIDHTDHLSQVWKAKKSISQAVLSRKEHSLAACGHLPEHEQKKKKRYPGTPEHTHQSGHNYSIRLMLISDAIRA